METTLTKKQTRQFRFDGTDEQGNPFILVATVRHDDQCGNGHNTFSITADILVGGNVVACGCLHDEIAKHYPNLKPLLKWHGCSTDGPMHYIANTVYLAGDRDCWGYRAGEQQSRCPGVLLWKATPETPRGLPHIVESTERPDTYEPLLGEGKARELDLARIAAVWPDATDAELMHESEALKATLCARLPQLMAEFRAAAESLGFTY